MKHATQQKLRKIIDLWWNDKAREIQSYADQHDYRNFFQAIKSVYGPSRRNLCPIQDNNGNLIKEERGIRSRWREHYSNILNYETTANHDILQVIPVSTTWTIRCLLSKSRQLSINLKNNKSSVCDGISAEIFKALCHNVCIHLKNLFHRIWETGTVPQDLRDALLVNLYKNKGNVSDWELQRYSSLNCWWKSAHQSHGQQINICIGKNPSSSAVWFQTKPRYIRC